MEEKEGEGMINTVLFDMGGTLEELYYGKDTLLQAAQGILKLLDEAGISPGITAEAAADHAEEGWRRYKEDWQHKCIELKPSEIWPKYILAEIVADKEKLDALLCERLAHMWEVTYFVRKLRPEVPAMLAQLKDLGLRMGVVSNTASEFQVFRVLEEYGIRDYFEDVTLSSIVRYRKPDPGIFYIALQQMQAQPECTAYVGDTISRDVVGPKRAGIALTFQIHSFLTSSRDLEDYGVQAEYVIQNISEVGTILAQLLEKAGS